MIYYFLWMTIFLCDVHGVVISSVIILIFDSSLISLLLPRGNRSSSQIKGCKVLETRYVPSGSETPYNHHILKYHKVARFLKLDMLVLVPSESEIHTTITSLIKCHDIHIRLILYGFFSTTSTLPTIL